jgi:hypothetical protein
VEAQDDGSKLIEDSQVSNSAQKKNRKSYWW